VPKAPAAPPAGPPTESESESESKEGSIASALQRYESILCDDEAIAGFEFQTRMNLLKVTASELATAVVMSTMQVNGLSGYRNDGEFSVARHLRDVLSSSIMINNDRILANTASVQSRNLAKLPAVRRQAAQRWRPSYASTRIISMRPLDKTRTAAEVLVDQLTVPLATIAMMVPTTTVTTTMMTMSRPFATSMSSNTAMS
jgi:hypothetical protein